MLNSYKYFSFEENKKWNNDFLNANKNGDKDRVLNLLKQVNSLYLDEYFISNSISNLNLKDLSLDEKQKMLESLKKCKLVKDVEDNKKSISIKTEQTTIKVSKLSDIIPSFHICDKNDNNPINKSQYRSQYISQILGFPNSIITGYIYGIADRAKTVSTWVEFKNNHNQEFVIFPDTNTIFNKEGFYYLKHAEPLKKVSSDDIKGKSSISKSGMSSSSNSELADIDIDVDINFDIDMDR